MLMEILHGNLRSGSANSCRAVNVHFLWRPNASSHLNTISLCGMRGGPVQ